MVARFDDPVAIPIEVGNHWPDLNSAAWRLFPCHPSTAAARTWDGYSVSHFMLLQGRESSSPLFKSGLMEIVARAPEDESSQIFGVVLPERVTWLHIFNWLRLGHGFPSHSVYALECNGIRVTNPLLSIHVTTGFFIQIFVESRTSEEFVGIPQGKAKMMSATLFQGMPSAVGTVYLAAVTLSQSDKARLPIDGRAQAIPRKWPFLTTWTCHRVHPSGRAREPPWQAFTDASIVNPISDGLHVAVLAAIFEGGGCVEHAIIVHRQAHLQTLYAVLECAFRCADAHYLCITTINASPAPLLTALNLQDGDYTSKCSLPAKQHQNF